MFFDFSFEVLLLDFLELNLFHRILEVLDKGFVLTLLINFRVLYHIDEIVFQGFVILLILLLCGEFDFYQMLEVWLNLLVLESFQVGEPFCVRHFQI